MDPEWSRLVDFAANIAPSGRWEAVNKRIEQLAAAPGKGNAWWVTVFACLCHQVFSEYLLLKRAYKEEKANGALLAWRARNLLELSIWSLYCAKSKENARRLYEDAGRDAFGLFNAFTEWGTGRQEPEWIDHITGAKQDLTQRAAAAGIDSLDGPYKRVRDAANECGLGEHFSLSYQMFSKFAHPTAMQIMGSPVEARTALQKDVFFSQGCLFFTGAFEALESALRSVD